MQYGLAQVKSHKHFGLSHDTLFHRQNRGISQKLIDCLPSSECRAMTIAQLGDASGIGQKKAKGAILYAIKNVSKLKRKKLNNLEVFWIGE